MKEFTPALTLSHGDDPRRLLRRRGVVFSLHLWCAKGKKLDVSAKMHKYCAIIWHSKWIVSYRGAGIFLAALDHSPQTSQARHLCLDDFALKIFEN